MPIVVQKFGGSSVADVEKIRKVALKVKARRDSGDDVVVVVSAMGDTTDELLALAKQVSADPPRRELDMLLSCGERISMALLSMALWEAGVPSISFTGSQSGILTDDSHSQARIVEVKPLRIVEELGRKKVVIVAGYQGVSYKREVTTLGRGGSDTTAVALAAALGANCEIYSDVDGVFTSDPRKVPDAKKLDALSYDEMQALASAGAKVLNAQAVEFAKEKGILIHALSTHTQGTGTQIFDVPKHVSRVKAVTLDDDMVCLSADLRHKSLADVLSFLELHQLKVRAFTFDSFGTEKKVWMTVPLQDVHGLEKLKSLLTEKFGTQIVVHQQYGSVTCVGVGVGTEASFLSQAMKAAFQEKVSVVAVHTSPIQFSLLVEKQHLLQLCRRLHAEFS